ncbi:MAG TPA: hypothetical protein VFW05_00825 [Verrucomicrobiae bacterium]|nr:hypothetical protein [Verrucomicrobiae bacterium]
MRILLRDKITGHYFAGDDSWTEKMEEAQNFPTGAHALSKAWRSGLKNMLAVYWFGSAAESFAIPVPSVRPSAMRDNISNRLSSAVKVFS